MKTSEVVGKDKVNARQSAQDGSDSNMLRQQREREHERKKWIRMAMEEPNGLGSIGNRRLHWPKLMSDDMEEVVETFIGDYQAQIFEHKEFIQVELDVARSFIHFPKALRPTKRNALKTRLSTLINAVLSIHSNLHYFQGYNDIASVLLLVMGERKAFVLLEELSLTKLQDHMQKSLIGLTTQLELLFPIISKFDSQLEEFLVKSEVGPHFSISWILTWFSHNVDDFDVLCRIFDLFLCSHPLMPIYLAAAVVIYRREQILSSECEYSTIHGLLTKLPSDLPFSHLIMKALEYSYDFPPPELLRSINMNKFKEVCPRIFQLLSMEFPEMTIKQETKSLSNSTKQIGLYVFSLSLVTTAILVINQVIQHSTFGPDAF